MDETAALIIHDKVSHLLQVRHLITRQQFEAFLYFHNFLQITRREKVGITIAANLVGRYRYNWMKEQMRALIPLGLLTEAGKHPRGFSYRVSPKGVAILAEYKAQFRELLRRMRDEKAQSIPPQHWPSERRAAPHHKTRQPRPGQIQHVER